MPNQPLLRRPGPEPKSPAATMTSMIVKRRKFLIVAAAFCLLGGTLLMRSQAATNSVQIEAESGQLSGNYGDGPTAGASGSKSVSFGKSGGGGTTPPPPTNALDPSGEGTTAAATLNWPAPFSVESFENLNNWGLYTQPGGEHGNRSPSQISVSGGLLTIKGEPGGKTGGMAQKVSQKYGRWEVRQKVAGDASCWRPVLLTWPTSEGWPANGEIDYAENGGGNLNKVEFFLHYSASNSQTHDSADVNMREWNNYAMEWTPEHIRGYVNGKQFFEDTNPSHFPPVAHHQTIQLDANTSCNGNTQQIVDWVRVYKV